MGTRKPYGIGQRTRLERALLAAETAVGACEGASGPCERCHACGCTLFALRVLAGAIARELYGEPGAPGGGTLPGGELPQPRC